MGNFYEVVESVVILVDVLSMKAEVNSNPNDTTALFWDLVNLLLEDVLAAEES